MPKLSKEIVKQLIEDGDYDPIIEECIPLCRSIAQQFVRPGYDFEDAFGDACLKLVEIVPYHDTDYSITTFVTRCLKNHLNDQAWRGGLIERPVQYRRGEYCDSIGMSEDEIDSEFSEADARTVRLIRATFNIHEDAGNGLPDKESSVSDRVKEEVEIATREIAKLDVRDSRMLWGHFDGASDSEIAEKFGLSPRHVRRRLKRLITEVRNGCGVENSLGKQE